MSHVSHVSYLFSWHPMSGHRMIAPHNSFFELFNFFEILNKKQGPRYMIDHHPPQPSFDILHFAQSNRSDRQIGKLDTSCSSYALFQTSTSKRFRRKEKGQQERPVFSFQPRHIYSLLLSLYLAWLCRLEADS